MHFAFINPCPNEALHTHPQRQTLVPASWPPLGVLYLATALSLQGIEVSVLDQPANGFTVDDTVQWVRHHDPDVLGVTTCTSSSQAAAVISASAAREAARLPLRVMCFMSFFLFPTPLLMRPGAEVGAPETAEGIVPEAESERIAFWDWG